MSIAVCYNEVPRQLSRGESLDRISEEGAKHEAAAVAAALEARGHRTVLIPLYDDAAAFAAALQAAAPEAVFNLCEGFWGDSGRELNVAALLELLGLPFTGSGPLCLGLSQDKALTKDLLRASDLPTPRSLVVHPGHLPPPGPPQLTYPLIVKPRHEDASLGITAESVVGDERRLHERISYVHRTYRQDALVEEFIAGREFNVAVLQDTRPRALPVAEIAFDPGLAHAIVGYEGKWLPDSREYAGTVPVCPAPLSSRQRILISEVAVRAFQVLGCRDYARVDFRLRDHVPYILEVNANPDISPDAGLARCAAAADIDYPELVERILQLTLQRKGSGRAAS